MYVFCTHFWDIAFCVAPVNYLLLYVYPLKSYGVAISSVLSKLTLALSMLVWLSRSPEFEM